MEMFVRMNSLSFKAVLCSGLIFLSCSGAQMGPDPNTQMDFSYVMAGEVHQLSELRRRPLILVLMRTSEVLSQLYMDGIAEAFSKTAGKLRFLVLTIEQNEAPFVETYVNFEKLPFPIGVAETDVKLGNSALGAIPGIPCTYFIDSEGRLESVIPGVIDTPALVKKAQRFVDR
jgi:hypothetical protein